MPRWSCLIAVLVLGGCDPGSLYTGPIVLDDGGISQCEVEVIPPDDGHHNPGQGCLTSGCHRNGGGPEFTVGGTLYLGPDGNETVGGATIVVIDGDGITVKMQTASNGNFWTSEALAPPLLIRASQCPLDNPMVSLSQSGDCNSGGCHGTNGDRASLE